MSKKFFRLKKRNGKLDMGKVIEFAFLLAVAIYLFTFAWDVFGIGPNKNVSIIAVEGGSDFREIAGELHTKNIIRHPMIFKVWARLKGASGNMQPGNHEIDKNMSYSAILRELTTKREGQVSVTFPEGLEIYRVCDLFVENELMTKDEFYAAANDSYDYWFLEGIDRENRLEGYLYPDTYFFARSESPRDMLGKMLDNFEKHMNENYRARAQELGYSFDEIVILASVIEREATGPSDEKRVSSVFHNRLKGETYPYLQSCATVQYVLKERKAVLSEKDTKIDSKYNTYQNKGLPVGPIASVPVDAIEAALYPEQTDYYFFGVNQAGVQVFAKTYEEHLRILEQE